VAFGDYVRVLRKYWITILVATLLGILVAGIATIAITPKYTATASVLFTPDSGTGEGQDLAFAGNYAQGRMVNYQALAASDTVLGPVVSADSAGNPFGLDLQQTPEQLSENVSAEFAPGSTTLTISVADESAQDAAKIAAAVANSLILQVRIIERQSQNDADGTVSTPVSSVNGSLINEPTVPGSASSPSLQLFLVAGALFGLLLGLAIAFLQFFRSNQEPKSETPPVPQPASASTAPAQFQTPPPPPQEPLFQPTAKPQNPKRLGRRQRR